MMSEQDVPSTSGVMESLKNVGDISMAVTSIARVADAKGNKKVFEYYFVVIVAMPVKALTYLQFG